MIEAKLQTSQCLFALLKLFRVDLQSQCAVYSLVVPEHVCAVFSMCCAVFSVCCAVFSAIEPFPEDTLSRQSASSPGLRRRTTINSPRIGLESRAANTKVGRLNGWVVCMG